MSSSSKRRNSCANKMTDVPKNSKRVRIQSCKSTRNKPAIPSPIQHIPLPSPSSLTPSHPALACPAPASSSPASSPACASPTHACVSPASAQSTTPTCADLDESVLKRYNIYIDPALHVIVCLSCSTAIHFEQARSHLVNHDFKGVPKKDELSALLHCGGALPTSEITFPTAPVEPIYKLEVVDGYKCKEAGCSHISASKRSTYTHFNDKHPQKRTKASSTLETTKVPIQILYKFRGYRVLLQVLHGHQQPSTSDGYKKYMAQVACRGSITSEPSTFHLPPNKTLQSNLLSSTNFGSIIEGKNTGEIRALVERPHTQDRYYPIITVCRVYFQCVALKLREVGILFLRWIMTLKS